MRRTSGALTALTLAALLVVGSAAQATQPPSKDGSRADRSGFAAAFALVGLAECLVHRELGGSQSLEDAGIQRNAVGSAATDLESADLSAGILQCRQNHSSGAGVGRSIESCRCLAQHASEFLYAWASIRDAACLVELDKGDSAVLQGVPRRFEVGRNCHGREPNSFIHATLRTIAVIVARHDLGSVRYRVGLEASRAGYGRSSSAIWGPNPMAAV